MTVVAAPPPIVVEGPGDAPPMMAVALSPGSVVEFQHSLPHSESFRRESRGAARPPQPPLLRRQQASRFQWPPDPIQEWTYIVLPPCELAGTCERTLDRPTTALEVAEFFASPRAASSTAYTAYATRWRHEIDAILHGSRRETS